jgi:hypothetical protein
MTEQQIETLEKLFPGVGGLIVFKQPNGNYCAASFVTDCPAMEELVDILVGSVGDPGALCMVLNKHYPQAPNRGDESNGYVHR